MSRSLRGRGGANGTPVLVECDPTDLDASARVRDVDQLPPGDRRAFLDAVAESDRSTDVAGLAVGDVVRYTEYYCVV